MATVSSPLTLSNGLVLPNRIVKAAMSEYMSDWDNNSCPASYVPLHVHWASSGAAVLITGNVMVSREHMEAPTNLAITGGMDRWLSETARAVAAQGSMLVAQISHSGRQTPVTVSWKPVAPSPVPLKLFPSAFMPPRELALGEIGDVRAAFVNTAVALANAGLAGVQVHAAHGYLLSTFLSPLTNLRTDSYGGSLTNRSRLLLEIVEEIRKAILPRLPHFIVAVKINSSDFQKGGFSPEDSLAVVRMLERAGTHFVEVSGGSYESVAFMGRGESGAAAGSAREAYFAEFAAAVRSEGTGKMRVMLTGGFESVAGMNDALSSGSCDLIGLARPFVTESAAVMREVVAGTLAGCLRRAETRVVSPKSPLRALNEGVEAIWYARQIHRIAAGQAPAPGLSPAASLLFAVPKYFVHPRWLWRILYAILATAAYLIVSRMLR